MRGERYPRLQGRRCGPDDPSITEEIVRPACSCVSNRLRESNNFPLKNLDGLPQGVIRQHFTLPRHQMNAARHRVVLKERFATWHGWTVTGVVDKTI